MHLGRSMTAWFPDMSKKFQDSGFLACLVFGTQLVFSYLLDRCGNVIPIQSKMLLPVFQPTLMPKRNWESSKHIALTAVGLVC